MPSVIIGSHTTKLELSCRHREPDGTLRTVLATLHGPALSATVSAYDFDFGSLVDFFDGLAASWRGWAGERSYESSEGDLVLTAIHDGHVRIVVRLRPVDGPGEWKVDATLTLDPGEDLAAATAQVRALVHER